MTRRLIPFLAAVASGATVTLDRSNDRGTIDGTTYSTAEPTVAVVPTVGINARNTSINEGTIASWIINTSEAISTPLTINVTVSQVGSYVAAGNLGNKSVVLPANAARVDYDVPTIDDSTDESDGSVTVALRAGTGYTVTTAVTSSRTINIRDNDEPAPALPSITVTRVRASVTEGSPANFVVRASTSPASPITINVTVSQTGSHANPAFIGDNTATLSGTSAVYSVSTVDDSTDEADGSITLTIKSGTGYTVGSPSSATTTVTDNDAAGFDSSATISLTANSGPSGLAIDSSDNFWVSDSSNKIYKYSSSGVFDSSATITLNVSRGEVHGVAIDSSGNIWAAELRTRKIYKFTSSGSLRSSDTITLTSNNGVPDGLAIDSSNNLWVADSNFFSDGGRRLYKYSSSGRFISGDTITLDSSNSNVKGVTIDSSGNFWVLDLDTDKIYKYSSSGTFDSSATISLDSQNSDARGLSIDSSGNFWVVDNDDMMYKYRP